MLCACGYFGGYRWGQLAAARDRYDQLPSPRAYDLSDLMADLPTTAHRERLYREIVARLKAAVPLDAWQAAGEATCDIYQFPATHSLVVLQRGDWHERIHAALQELRRSLHLRVEGEAETKYDATTP
jgi:hypothetical protein